MHADRRRRSRREMEVGRSPLEDHLKQLGDGNQQLLLLFRCHAHHYFTTLAISSIDV